MMLSKPTLNAIVQSSPPAAAAGDCGGPLWQLGVLLQETLAAHKSPIYHVGLEFAFDLRSAAGYELTSAFMQQYMQMKGRFKQQVTGGT
jgi:hypothetical protein